MFLATAATGLENRDMYDRRWRVSLLVVAACALLSGWAAAEDESTGRPFTMTLLHTNDTHSRLEPFPRDRELSASDPGPQQGGIARRKSLIEQIRANAPNVVLLDAGDFFQGTIFYNAWKGSAEVMGLNALGYDAVTLGNHEFDLGPVELGRALRGEPVAIAGVPHDAEKLRPPVVATNIDASQEPALNGLLRSSVVLERGGERLGILGVITPDVPTISSPGPRLRFLDYVGSVQAEADRLQAQGIDKIILLSHTGYPVDVAHARQLRGVDVIVSGHDHALLGDPATVDAVAPGQGARVKGPYPTVVTAADGQPVLVVSAYEWGRWLGQLQVAFDQHGVIERWQAQPIFVRGCAFVQGTVDCSQQVGPEDPTVKAEVARYREPVDRFASAHIGQAGIAFDAGNGVASVRRQEMPLGNLIADVMLAAAAASDRAVAAIANGGGIRAGIAPGEVRFEQALAVLPFGNTLVTVDLSGEQLAAALDHGLTRGGGAFPQVAGLKLVYCAAEPCPQALRPQGRVTQLTVDGHPVELTASYRIAVNSFMARGGDAYPVFRDACASGRYCRDSGVLDLDLLVQEFKNHSPVVRQVEGRIVAQ